MSQDYILDCADAMMDLARIALSGQRVKIELDVKGVRIEINEHAHWSEVSHTAATLPEAARLAVESWHKLTHQVIH